MELRITCPLEAYTALVHERDELRAENELMRNLLAECFPLVRPGTDLSRRLREAFGNAKDG